MALRASQVAAEQLKDLRRTLTDPPPGLSLQRRIVALRQEGINIHDLLLKGDVPPDRVTGLRKRLSRIIIILETEFPNS